MVGDFGGGRLRRVMKPRAGSELCIGGEFAGRPLGPSAGFTRRTLMRPSAQTTVKPSVATSTISPILPAMPLGSRAGNGFFEHLQCRPVERRPRAGRRVAAADEVVDLPPGLAPVDAGVVRAAAALIGGLPVILLDARRLAGLDQVDRLQHRLDAHRKQPVEIDRAERVVGPIGVFCNSTSPVSRPLSGQKIDSPVSVSPWMIGQLIALGRDISAAARDGTGSSHGSGR